MKRIVICVCAGVFLITLTLLSTASEKDEGVASEVPMVEEVAVSGSMKKSDSSEWGVSNSARAIMAATQDESQMSGRVDFVQTGGGIQSGEN